MEHKTVWNEYNLFLLSLKLLQSVPFMLEEDLGLKRAFMNMRFLLILQNIPKIISVYIILLFLQIFQTSSIKLHFVTVSNGVKLIEQYSNAL